MLAAPRQPPGFAETLTQISRLHEQLLQQHEDEVVHLRRECTRLAELQQSAPPDAEPPGPGDAAGPASDYQTTEAPAQGPLSTVEHPQTPQIHLRREPIVCNMPRLVSGASSDASQPRTPGQRPSGWGAAVKSRGDTRNATMPPQTVDRSPCASDFRPSLSEPGARTSFGSVSLGRGRTFRRRSASSAASLLSGVVPPEQSSPCRAGAAEGLAPEPAGRRASGASRASSVGSQLQDTGQLALRDVWDEGPGSGAGAFPQHAKSRRSITRTGRTLAFLAAGGAGNCSRAPERSWSKALLHLAFRARLLCEMLGVVLVVHDVVVAPTFSFDWPSESTTYITDWISRIFWTADVAASFFTGVYINSELELRFSQVARHYATGWMAFDVAIVLSEWIPLAVAAFSSEPAAVDAVLDALRLLRLARVLRLWKLGRLLENMGSVFDSKLWEMMSAVFRIPLCFLVGIHLVACGWFWVGSGSTDGWVTREISYQQDVGCKYLMSVYWALSQLRGSGGTGPGNASESLYAIFALLAGLGSFCFAVSYATAGVLHWKQSHSSAIRQRSLICRHLRTNHISAELATAIKNCFDVHVSVRKKAHKDVEAKEAVAFLPLNLQMDLAEEIRRPLVVMYNFFGDIDEGNPRIVRELCHHVFSEKAVGPAEVVFEAGDACYYMYFIMRGVFQYAYLQAQADPGSERASQSSSGSGLSDKSSGLSDKSLAQERLLDRGMWVSEAVLWTKWEHRGELKPAAGGALLQLEALRFAAALSQHHAGAYAYACRYGREFVRILNQCPESTWSDVLDEIRITKEDVFNDIFSDDQGDELSHTAPQLSQVGHYIFISHHKADGGTEATLMQEALERIISEDPDSPGHGMMAPVFLDSEDLSDLADLRDHVRNTRNLVLLLTEEVLRRPWVLVEIATAYHSGVHIVPVEIYKRDNKSFTYPGEEFYKQLREGDLLTEKEADLIKDEGITFDELEKAIRHVFKKIAVPFSPHKSQLVREAELTDILRRCVGTVARSESKSTSVPAELPHVPFEMTAATSTSSEDLEQGNGFSNAPALE